MALRRSLISLFTSSNSSSLIHKSKSKISFNISLYFSTSIEKEQPFTVSQFLTNHHCFSPKAASVLTNLNNPVNYNSVLTFLKETGFSTTQLSKILKNSPQCLTGNLENTIKPKIAILQEMGFSGYEIAEMISRNPVILQSSIRKRIVPSLSILKGLLGSTVKMAKVLTKSSWVLSVDLEKNLLPNIEFLKSCGIGMEDIVQEICSNPKFFLIKPENMRKHVEKAGELGVDSSSKMFFYAVQVVGRMSNETLEVKFRVFRDLGFSEGDILRAFRSTPLVFSVSKEKMWKLKEVLLETKKYDVSCIVNNPISLRYSVETRYKPRLQVLGILERKNLIEKWPSLSRLAQDTDEQFCEKYVDPFSNELLDLKLMIVSKSR